MNSTREIKQSHIQKYTEDGHYFTTSFQFKQFKPVELGRRYEIHISVFGAEEYKIAFVQSYRISLD